MHTTLVIMAAGVGSRFGKGIKQLAKMGPGGEVIMDYSIYDAKQAGFDKVVFIIRKDIEAEFREVIGDRIAKQIQVEYVYQELSDLPAGFTLRFDTVSGAFDSGSAFVTQSGDAYTYGDGSTRLEVSTVSGSLYLQ